MTLAGATHPLYEDCARHTRAIGSELDREQSVSVSSSALPFKDTINKVGSVT